MSKTVDVRTLHDHEGIPEGSFIRNCEVNAEGEYVGMWCSMWGSYTVAVPGLLCEIVTDKGSE